MKVHHPHHRHNFEDFAIGYLVGKSSAGSPQQQVSHDSRGWLGWAISFVVVSGLAAMFFGPLLWPNGLEILQAEPLAGILILVLAFVLCSLPFVLVVGIIVALADEGKFNAEMLRQSQEHQQKINCLNLAIKKKQEIVDARKNELRAMLESEIDVEKFLSEQINLGQMTYAERNFYLDWSNLERHNITIKKCQEFLRNMAHENCQDET